MVVKCCQLIRAVVSDDDVRVEFGRAHEYACKIAEQENGLELLTSLLTGKRKLKKKKTNRPRFQLIYSSLHVHLLFFSPSSEFEAQKEVIGELMPTLSRLAVRNEFCQKIVELGGLRFVVDVLVKYYDDKELVESSFVLIKALAGNDDVKREVNKGNAIPLITAALDRHKVKCVPVARSTPSLGNGGKERFWAFIESIVHVKREVHNQELINPGRTTHGIFIALL